MRTTRPFLLAALGILLSAPHLLQAQSGELDQGHEHGQSQEREQAPAQHRAASLVVRPGRSARAGGDPR